MKQNWFAGTLGALALAIGATGTPLDAAYAVTFAPPTDNAAPRTATGGASRGNFFTPPTDSAAPRQSSGGASRSGLFTPPTDSAAPQRSSTGGASRGDFFTPPTDSAAPRRSAGGASRGDFFTPPPDNSSPQSTSGGASRGNGLFEGETEAVDTANLSSRSNAYGTTANSAGLAAPSMLAITPGSFYGTTLEARPTILVYVPASNAQEAIFSLKDEAKNLVYQMTVPVPSSGGVVAIEMPAAAPELVMNENYQWYLAMKLDNELSSASPFVDGWVKRIELSTELAASLGQGNALSDVEALGSNGIWYDTAAQLALLQEVQGDETIANHWYELLESVGLADVAVAPIVM